jgi:hypothetical protein
VRGARILGGIIAIAIAGCGAFLGADGADDPPAGGGGAGDAGADGGGSVADANGVSDGESSVEASADAQGPLRVFITEQTYLGDQLSQVSCQDLAAMAGLDGVWVEWLSFAGVNAKLRINADGPWQTLDGHLVAKNKSELVSGSLQHAIDHDQNGAPAAGDVWTGTAANGTATQATCDSWRVSTGLEGTFGQSSATSAQWTESNNGDCGLAKRVYCFQIR